MSEFAKAKSPGLAGSKNPSGRGRCATSSRLRIASFASGPPPPRPTPRGGGRGGGGRRGAMRHQLEIADRLLRVGPSGAEPHARVGRRGGGGLGARGGRHGQKAGGQDQLRESHHGSRFTGG